MKLEFPVESSALGLRIDKFLASQIQNTHPEISRTKIQNLIACGAVSDENNRAILDPAQKIKTEQKIQIILEESKPQQLQPKKIDFEIVFEDADLLVINKPAGLTVHPGAGNAEHTLVNALLYTHQGQLSKAGEEFRPGIVHRLDKDTSGLMLVAKNDFAHFHLSNQIKTRAVKRIYLALIYGKMLQASGRIEKGIARSRKSRLKMTISEAGRHALTFYRTKEIYLNGFASLLECRLETGRTHQIRVHLNSCEHSVIGDKAYNDYQKSILKLPQKLATLIKNFPRQALHSHQISFTHPRDERQLEFVCELPSDIAELRNELLLS